MQKPPLPSAASEILVFFKSYSAEYNNRGDRELLARMSAMPRSMPGTKRQSIRGHSQRDWRDPEQGCPADLVAKGWIDTAGTAPDEGITGISMILISSKVFDN